MIPRFDFRIGHERIRLRGHQQKCMNMLHEKMGEMKFVEDENARGAAKTFKIVEANAWHGNVRPRKH